MSFARHLDKPAIATQGATSGTDLPSGICASIGPDNDGATLSMDLCIGADLRTRAQNGAFRIHHRRIVSLKVPADTHEATALGA